MEKKSMLEGNIHKSILLFALPLLWGNMFQQFYNIADTAIVGNLAGEASLAAVGAAAPIYTLIISFANGCTNGFSIILAQKYGARDERAMQQVVTWTYVLTIGMSVLLTVGSMVFLRPLLKFLNTPDHIIGEADSYLRIILAFVAVTMLYNTFAGLLRALGDSKTPLYFLIFSSLVNVVLDIIFVGNLGMGVSGAAYATVIATCISMLLCIVFIAKKYPILRFHTKYVGKNMSYAKELLSTGLSMGFMIVVTSIGTVALQGAVNSLGETIIAAHISARKIDDIFMWPLGSLALATSTFTSQNFGAGQYKRVHDGIKGGIHLALIWSVFSIVVLFSFGGFLIPLISGSRNADILNAAKMYIRINSAFFPALCILLILRSSLQGLGRKLMPNIGSIIEMVLKFGSVNLIAAGLGYFGVCMLEPAVWIICTPLLAWNYRKTISYIMKTSFHANEKSIGNTY